MEEVRLAEAIPPEPVRWLWKDRIPCAETTAIAGRPGEGKSMLAARIAADVTQAGGNVIYSAVEDSAEVMTRPRLEAAGADLRRVMIPGLFLLPQELEDLEVQIASTDTRLVVLDPFNAHLSGVSRYSDNIRKVLNPLRRLSRQYDCSFLVIEHLLKKSKSVLGAIGGSGSGLAAAARMVYLWGRNPEDTDHGMLCNVKASVCQQRKPFAFEFDTTDTKEVGEIPLLLPQGEVEFDVEKLVKGGPGENGKRGRKPEKRAAAGEWLSHYLFNAGKPMKASEIFEDGNQHQFSAKVLRGAADDLGVLRDPPGGGRLCTWELPEGLKGLLETRGKEES